MTLVAKRIKLFKNTEHLRTSKKCPLKSELFSKLFSFLCSFQIQTSLNGIFVSSKIQRVSVLLGEGKVFSQHPLTSCTCPAVAPARRLRGRVWGRRVLLLVQSESLAGK